MTQVTVDPIPGSAGILPAAGVPTGGRPVAKALPWPRYPLI